jgi:hypothetical protein
MTQRIGKDPRLFFFSLDTLFLMFLVLPTLKYDFVSALAVSAVGVYILADLVFPTNNINPSGESPSRREGSANFLKTLLIIWIIVIVAITPTIFNMISRPKGQPDAQLHDGAFQTEVALRYLANGKNPYAESYFGTGLEQYGISNVPENPALYNFVYFPVVLLSAYPLFLLTSATMAWFDQRLVFLVFFLIGLIAVPRLSEDPMKKRLLLILVGLNIYTVEFLQTGRNDILIFVLLMLAIVFLKMEKVGTAGIFLALACGAKPSAWFFVPFLTVYLARGLSWRAIAEVWLKRMIPFWLTVILTILPFVIWDAGAFWRSTVAYTFGFSNTPLFPVQGYGFSTILLLLGIVASPLAQFPFIVFQVIASMPVFLVTMRAQLRDNHINRALLNGALLFLTFMFFSRFFHDNYLQFAVMAIGTAVVMDSFTFEPNHSGSS